MGRFKVSVDFTQPPFFPLQWASCVRNFFILNEHLEMAFSIRHSQSVYFVSCIHRFSQPLTETGLAQKSLEQPDVQYLVHSQFINGDGNT